MIPAEFLKLIEKYFDEEEQQVLVASLYQDSRVLHVLKEFSDLDEIPKERFTKLENWSPLYFGLIQSNDKFWKRDLSSLRLLDLQQIEDELSLEQLAATAFFSGDRIDLKTAALYAVKIFNAAKERSWQDVKENIFHDYRFNTNAGLITACLIGLFRMPEEFVSAVLDGEQSNIELRKTVLYALLCHPQPEKELMEQLQVILLTLDEESKIELLQFLIQIGREEKARALISNEKKLDVEEEKHADRLTLKRELAVLEKNNYTADLNCILNDKKSASESLEYMLENCKSIERQIHEKLDRLKKDEKSSSDQNDLQLPAAVQSYDWKRIPHFMSLAALKQPPLEDLDRYLLDAEETIGHFPENSAAHLDIADFYSDLGDNSRAANHLRIAHILDTEDTTTQMRLMDLYNRNEQWQAALELSSATTGKEKSISRLEPFFQELHLLLQKGDTDVFQQKLTGFLTEAQIEFSEDLQRIAKIFVEVGDFEQALLYFEESISAGTTDFRAWIGLCECLLRLQQNEKADQTLEEALDIFKERKGFYAALVNMLLHVGEDDQGLALLEKIKIDESDPLDLAGIIHFLQQHKHHPYAQDFAVTASRRYPLHAKLGIEVAYVLLENGEFERTRKILKWIHADQKDTMDYLQLHILSNLNSSISRFPLDSKVPEGNGVLQSLHESMKHLPDDSFWKGLIDAELHYIEKDNTKAIDLYKQMILANSISKNRAEIWRAQVGLAKAMMKAGQLETAITLLTEALREKKDCLALYDLLIEAYQDTNLTTEAFATARAGYLACRKDAHIIQWYIHQLTTLGKMDEIKAFFQEEQKFLQSSPSFLIEKLSFVNKYGTPGETRRILDDLQTLDNLSTQDLLQMIEISEEIHYSDSSIQSLRKVGETAFPDMERRFLEICIHRNNGYFDTARRSLEEMSSSPAWEGLVSIIRFMMDYSRYNRHPSLLEINQIIANSKDSQKQLYSLSATVQKVLPSEWKDAIRSNSVWLQMVIQNLINGEFDEDDIEDQLEIFAGNTEDAIVQSELTICEWMIRGDSGQIDWLAVLNSLDGMEAVGQKENMQGIILNIMLQGENEIAVVDQLNQIESSNSQNTMLLLAKARLLEKNGNITEARDCFLKATQSEKKSKDAQESTQDISTQLADFCFWRAECAFDLGLWKEASVEYFSGLVQTRKMKYISTFTLTRILELAWKEWSYQKIGISNHLPEVLEASELRQLDDFLQNLPADEKRDYTKVLAFLHDEQVTFSETGKGEGLIACLSSFLTAIQNSDMDEVLQLVNTSCSQYELALSAITLIPEDATADLIQVIQNDIFHNKKNAYYYVGLAKILQIQGEQQLAIDALETALSLLDDEPLLQTQLASLYEEEGEYEKAIVFSAQAIKNDPQNENVIRTYLLNLVTVHDYTAAIEQFEKNKSVFDKDELIIKKMIEAYYQTEQYRKALEIMKTLGEDPQNDIEQVLMQAKIARKLKSYPKAMQLIRKAYELDPQSPEVIIELARIKTLQESEEFGLEIVDKALESKIQSDSLILEKVRYLKKVYSEKRALDFLESYLENNREPAFTVLNQYGQMQNERGEVEKAIDAYERSLKKNDRQSEIHTEAGKLYVKTGNLDMAVNHFDKAVKQNSSQMDAYLQLCDVFLKRREEKRAEKIITNAIQDCEEHYLIYDKAAQVYNQLGDVDKAEMYLRKAAEINPGDEKLREKLGILIANRIFEKKNGNS